MEQREKMANQNNQEKQKVIQAEKARIGAIGEEAVIIQLLRKKWDAFNANATLTNYKSVDVVALRYDENTKKPITSLIQVKSMSDKSDLNFPTGFTLKEAKDRKILEEKIKGPYVFVKVKDEDDKDKENAQDKSKEKGGKIFDCYIVPRSQIIELIYISNNFYIDKIKENKEVLTGPACVRLLWIEGNDRWAKTKNIPFGNPIPLDSTHENWDNIWKD